MLKNSVPSKTLLHASRIHFQIAKLCVSKAQGKSPLVIKAIYSMSKKVRLRWCVWRKGCASPDGTGGLGPRNAQGKRLTHYPRRVNQRPVREAGPSSQRMLRPWGTVTSDFTWMLNAITQVQEGFMQQLCKCLKLQRPHSSMSRVIQKGWLSRQFLQIKSFCIYSH